MPKIVVKKDEKGKKPVHPKKSMKQEELAKKEWIEATEKTTTNGLFFNRELSWLEFNERVLQEAQDKTNPILERFKFLAISASNLDEFFMVRVSSMFDLLEADYKGIEPSGRNVAQQLQEISLRAHQMVQKQYNCLNRALLPQLAKKHTFFREFEGLTKPQKEFVRSYFESTLYPILTPMAIDQSRPFPLLSNKSLNLIVSLDCPEDDLFAVVQVPSVVPRFLVLPHSEANTMELILTEDIIKAYVFRLFSGHTVLSCFAFRITRNADLTIDEEDAQDLLSEIEQSIKRRKWGQPVRLEIEKNMGKNVQSFLQLALELDENDLYPLNGPLDLTLYMGLLSISSLSHLKQTSLPPVPSVAFWQKEPFSVIRENDVLVHHPYESFDCVLTFVQNAASDPQVLAIKQTLYRVSGHSPIVAALILAAENGKQVTVLVELKARFDEENNILWAKKLEKAGCHVVYGLVGLKTHCKICLVVRREEDGIRRYIHLGTGNYNDNTAKIYTDMGLFTCKESFGQDISSLFNVLTGYSINLSWNKIAVAPVSLRQRFMQLIENETQNALLGKKAKIVAKMNSLVDTEIIKALYKASSSGVSVDLIVRGICCLVPGVLGMSENIRVASVVDRFLEHSRIFYFENDNNPLLYLASADWMPRNLDKRVEVAFPIEDKALLAKAKHILDLTLSDTMKLRYLKPDGTYARIDKRGKEPVHSQLLFYQEAEEAFKHAHHHSHGRTVSPNNEYG